MFSLQQTALQRVGGFETDCVVQPVAHNLFLLFFLLSGYQNPGQAVHMHICKYFAMKASRLFGWLSR